MDDSSGTTAIPLDIAIRKKKTVSKYAKYDNILGPSRYLTMKKKKNRVETFEKASIHSMEELLSILRSKKKNDDLTFNLKATIPFSAFNLQCHPLPKEVDILYDNIREQIYQATGIVLVLNHTDRAKDNVTRSKRYICRQDKKGDVSKKNRCSNLKRYNCNSRFIFKYKDKYAFVELDIIHAFNHQLKSQNPLPTPTEPTNQTEISPNTSKMSISQLLTNSNDPNIKSDKDKYLDFKIQNKHRIYETPITPGVQPNILNNRIDDFCSTVGQLKNDLTKFTENDPHVISWVLSNTRMLDSIQNVRNIVNGHIDTQSIVQRNNNNNTNNNNADFIIRKPDLWHKSGNTIYLQLDSQQSVTKNES